MKIKQSDEGHKEKTAELSDTIVSEFLKAVRTDIEIAPPRQGSIGSVIVSLPFIQEDGHWVEAEVRKLLSGYVRISDMENQISELALRGFDVTPRVRKVIEKIAIRYNLKLEGDEIITIVKLKEVGKALRDVLQAQLAISYLRFFSLEL